MKIKPIILSGGFGKRLWPLSRENMPKQFFDLFNKNTNLFEQTLKRVNNLRRDFGKHRIQINSNRVYHPQFHQVALIPQEYREELALELEEEFPKLEQLQDITTRNTILNHINFLKNSAFDEKHSPATEEAILQDMIKFLDQYLILQMHMA